MQSRMTVLRREGRSLVSRVEKALADLRKAAPRLPGGVLVPLFQPRLLHYTAARSSTASVAQRNPTITCDRETSAVVVRYSLRGLAEGARGPTS